ncbi:hypothetical protein BAE44_0014001 [Dichanthelium oligosanthes]|uniref:Uncharacterized protein n=1 Tax=Dichanthelium oligosanthes TaxID=888268 RepID=A0A1E5VIP0_9POAL|nr:hypothetical protein BAE44_0014001 [Dichanthelium oligosanthes]
MGGKAMRAGVAAAMATAVFLAVAVSGAVGALVLSRFAEAPEYRNGEGCLVAAAGLCDPGLVHIAMTLAAKDPEPELLRRAVAASFPSLRFYIPRLRRARSRRRLAPLGDAPACPRRRRGARVLPRQLLPLLHAGLLV